MWQPVTCTAIYITTYHNVLLNKTSKSDVKERNTQRQSSVRKHLVPDDWTDKSKYLCIWKEGFTPFIQLILFQQYFNYKMAGSSCTVRQGALS